MSEFKAKLTNLPPSNWSIQHEWYSNGNETTYLIGSELAIDEHSAETPRPECNQWLLLMAITEMLCVV